MRENYPEKKFLAARALAKRESLALSHLTSWCEAGDLEARRIGDQWFIALHDWEANGGRLADWRLSVIRPASGPLILLAAIFLLGGIFNSAPFRTGSAWLTAAANQTAHRLTERETVARMSSVYDILWIRLDRLWLKVDRVAGTFADNLIYFWHQAGQAWRGFLNNRDVASSPPLALDPAALETLKNEIRAELLRDLKPGAVGNIPSAPSAAPGLVVLPSSGDSTRDEALKLELKNSFSDQVEVKFDPSGQAGIITPIFQSGRGDNYLFILTPLKRSP